MNGAEQVQIAELAATLREMDKRIEEQFEHHDKYLGAEIRRLTEHIVSQREQINAALEAAQRAVDKAQEAATKQADAHNDLIRKGERKEQEYATKAELEPRDHRITRLENFQAKIIGAVGAVGFASTVLGIVSLIITLSH